jgi:hypothetical protein
MTRCWVSMATGRLQATGARTLITPVVDDRLLYTLDRRRCAGFQLKVVPYQRLNGI